MIGIVQSIITSPGLFNAASNTASQVALKTCMQAVGQPTFVLVNNQLDPQTKMFSATKEFLYQMLCLIINFALIIPVFQKNAFKFAKGLYKEEPVFKTFKNMKDFKKYTDFEKIEDKTKFLKEIGSSYTPDNINEKFGRGMTNLVSIIGSVLGLAILAPLVSKPIVRPVLKAIGLDDGKGNGKKAEDKKLNKTA